MIIFTSEIKVISTFPTCFFKAIFLEGLYSLPFELQRVWEKGKNVNVSVLLRALYQALHFYSIEHLLILDGLRLEELK